MIAHSSGLIIMSIMQSLRQIFPIIGFLLILIFVPVIFAGYSDLAAARLAVSPRERAHYAELAAVRIPWASDMYEVAGIASLEANEYQDAIRMLETAQVKSILSSSGQFALGKAYLSIGEPEKALAQWQTLPDGDPATVSAGPYLADAYHARALFDDEERVLRRWLALDPQNADAHYRLSLLLFSDALPDAFAHFETAATSPALAPSVDGLRTALNTAHQDENPAGRLTRCGQTLAAMGEWTLALRTFSRATEADPNYALAWAWLAEALQRVPGGKPLEALQRAVELAPADAQVQAMLGIYWQRQQRWVEAHAAFDEAARLEPRNVLWQISLGDVYIRLGDLVKALAYYQKATDLAPTDAQTWRALALFTLENASDVDGIGRNAALRAYSLQPDNPQNMDILGRTLMATQEYDSAEAFFLKALDAAPQAAAPAYHLGVLYLCTNQLVLAEKYLHMARTFEPNGPSGTQAADLLARYFP